MSRHALSPLFDPQSVLAVGPPGLPLLAALPPALRARTVELPLDAHGALALPAELAAPQRRPDLAVVAAPAGKLRQVLEALAPARPAAAVVISHEPVPGVAQFCRDWARANDCQLLGPRSFGLQRPHAGLNASLHPQLARSGRVAMVTQSRSIMAVVMDWADDNRTGFSAVVSLGDEAVLDLPTVLDFLVADPHTDSIALYLEHVRDAREFMSAMRAAASVKPVAVLKADRGGGPRRGDAAGIAPDTVFDAALRRAGAVRVAHFVQLFSAVKALGFRRRPTGRRIAVLANGRGPARLALDRIAASDGTVARAELAPATREALLRALGPSAQADNPVVALAPLAPGGCAEAVAALAADPGVDGLLVVLAPDPDADLPAVARALAEAAPRAGRPVITCFMGDAAMRPLRRVLDDVGSPSFRTPESAVEAFGNLAIDHYNRQLLLQMPPPQPPGRAPDTEGARVVIGQARADARSTLTEPEAKALLAAFHIPVVPVLAARHAAEAVIAAQQIGFPVAIKIDSPDVARKSAVRGVHLDIRSSAELVTAYQRMMANVREAEPGARIAGITVEAMASPPGAPKVAIGVARDALFGPVIRFGSAAGARAEPAGSLGVELPPLNGFLARRLIERTRIWRHVLSEQVSARAHELLEDILVRISDLVCGLPEIESIEINPVIIDGDRVLAADTRITLLPGTEGAADDPGVGGYAHMAIHPYPVQLVRHCQFADGTPYTIRPIRPEDAAPLQAFTRGLSEHSRYMRFISAMRELSPNMLARYTQVDYHRELALVATVLDADAPDTGETLIGVARYLLNPDGDSAEYALVVADAWQRRGLGRELMTALVDAARRQGLRRIEGFVLGANGPMLKLMGSLGFHIQPDPDDPSMRQAWLDLERPPN
ncbi:GNAT family N-acetyltransferase [Pigmentiphaga soli]|uniref:GNAT family N-acetyltransferase n=1 Tax=Pigmentiphaga soli TaxID=1007095 RepID=A0ABP8HTJ0_9BURK